MRKEAGTTEMKVIVINGSMGVGKTTVGKTIADRYPGTAFIDGDWCMDLHPLVGNAETRAMAVDNILHMVGNYLHCSACSMVVLVWLMDDPQVCRQVIDGISALQTEAEYVTLTCDAESLARRWKNDRECEWRTDEWLEASLKSLPRFAAMENPIDTGALTIEQVANRIMSGDCEYGRTV